MLPNVAALVAILALGACTASNPTASTGAGATPASLPPSHGGSPNIPSASPSSHTNADPELAARFPKTIAGQPVTNLQTFNFVKLMAALGTPKATVDQFNTSTTAVSIDPGTITLGTAEVTVGTQSQEIQAFRSPGGDAIRLVRPLATVAQLAGIGTAGTASPVALTPASLGGKRVAIASSAVLTQYYYPTGDTVFVLNSITSTAAATILAALP
jgi:hypothetical protein